MYLMDMVNQCAVRLGDQGGAVAAGYLDLAARLHGTPRFLLDANATRTAVELNLGRPKITREAMAHIRIPYRRMWVEWDDNDRQKLRERFDEPQTYAELRPMPGRVGFLLDTDASGRSGTATWAWDTPSGLRDIPNVGAIEAYFDLDRTFEMPEVRRVGLLKGNLGRMWRDNPVQLAALFDIWRTSVHRPTAWAEPFWQATGNPDLAEALSYSDVVGEYIMIWAALLLLTASRPIVDLIPVDMGRLNKKRLRKREIPLLDHTRMVLHLTPQAQRPGLTGPLGYSRKSPRVHMVSSYLARRGNQHWIVEPYWRGKGDVVARHVRVKG